LLFVSVIEQLINNTGKVYAASAGEQSEVYERSTILAPTGFGKNAQYASEINAILLLLGCVASPPRAGE